jgi:hypothetical protein
LSACLGIFSKNFQGSVNLIVVDPEQDSFVALMEKPSGRADSGRPVTAPNQGVDDSRSVFTLEDNGQ